MTSKERWILFEKCIKSVDDIRAYLSGWFRGEPFDRIKRGDIYRFLSWAFFVRKPAELSHEEIVDIGRMMAFIERRFRIRFENGDNHLKCMRLNFDPVAPKYRPLIYYLVILVAQQFFTLYLRIIGWKRHRSIHHPLHQTLLATYPPQAPTTINYWILKNSTSPQPPLVFIHGIGVGLFAYNTLVQKLSSSNRTIIMLELPHVSTLLPVLYSRMVERLIAPREFALEIENILHYHGYSQAHFVGHSLGSTVLSWCIKYAPHIVDGTVFIDPVCFMLHHPDVAYNFVYRKPKTVDQLLFHWFASRELYISWFLARGFIWYDNVLFFEDIPKDLKVTIILSEDDCIVPVTKILRKLPANTNVQILKGLNHAGFLMHAESEKTVLKLILH